MDRDHVRLGEQLVELAVLRQLRVHASALRVEHAQLESGRTTCDRLSDASEPDDAESRARELFGEEAVRPRARPRTGADGPVSFDDPPANGQDQREREIGGRG